MLRGSCLCGAVAYEVDAPAGPIAHCHCRTCRKTHGAAFSTVMPVPRHFFRWLRGKELLSTFESSPGKLRRFCTRCGSHIVAERPNQPNVLLRLGCLDTPITIGRSCTCGGPKLPAGTTPVTPCPISRGAAALIGGTRPSGSASRRSAFSATASSETAASVVEGHRTTWSLVAD